MSFFVEYACFYSTFGILQGSGFVIQYRMRKEILERLVLLRKRAGFSARELSLKINRQEGYIGKVECGNHFPPVEDLESILKACNSSFEELFYEDFNSYWLDKDIIRKLKDVTPEGKNAIITLLVLMHQQGIQTKDKEEKSS